VKSGTGCYWKKLRARESTLKSCTLQPAFNSFFKGCVSGNTMPQTEEQIKKATQRVLRKTPTRYASREG